MFEELRDESGVTAAPVDLFASLAAQPPPPPRPRAPADAAERFCDGLEGPAPEPGWGASSGERSVPVSPEIETLQQAIAAVAAIDPSRLNPAQALADATAVLEAHDALRLTALTRVADVDNRKLHRIDGSPTTTSWLRRHDSELTSSDTTLARRLPTLPTVSGAMQDRSLSVAAAGKIAKRLAKLRRWVDRPDGLIDGQPAAEALQGVIVDGVRGQVCQALGGLADDDPRLVALMADLAEIEQRPTTEIARLEAAFVLLGQHIEAALLPQALGTLVDALLPHEHERRAADAHDKRGFGFHPDFDRSGWHVTDGDLDLELGELLHTVITAMLAADPEAPADTEAYRQARQDGWSSADGADGLGSGDPPPPRSLRQRRHDALKRALRLLLDSGALGQRDKVAPHIGVTVGEDWLHRRPGATPAVADSGARIPRSLVREWWCDSSVSRFVLSLGRKVIETSHTERTLKAHERRAKRIETGGRCQAAGCRCRPGDRLIPHHPNAWCRTGMTSKDDTVLFCDFAHAHLHRGATIRLRDGRLLNESGWV